MAFLTAILLSVARASSDCIDRENDPTGADYQGNVNYYNHPQYGRLVSVV